MIVQAIRTIISWFYTLLLLVPTCVLSTLTFHKFAFPIWGKVARLWGKGSLKIVGINCILENEPSYSGQSRRIILINHQSILDMVWFASIAPNGFSGIAKKSMLYMPIVNWVMWSSRQIFIDRRNRVKAIRTLDGVIKKLRKDNRTICFSPEGTRTRDGEMGPFKKGAFHIAIQSGLTIHPIVVAGAYELMPPGSLFVKPGTIRLRFLDPIETSDWKTETIEEHMEEVHGKMLLAYDKMRAS